MQTPNAQPSPTDFRQELAALRETVRRQAAQIAQLEAVLKEVVEISFLPEADRRVRAEEYRRNRLTRLKQQIDHVTTGGHFERLEPLLRELQHAFPDEPEAEEVRLAAWTRRDAVLADALKQLRERISAMISVGQWQQAIDLVKTALDRFPDQPELLDLIAQIRRAHDAWRDGVVNRLYAQIKEAIDRREWRRALRDAEEMTARFSDHPRGVKIVQQLATIRDNAQIEQRQEMERNLQQFIQAHRYDDAIVLAEQMISFYPLSPQAAECRALIPRLQQLAMQAEADRRR